MSVFTKLVTSVFACALLWLAVASIAAFTLLPHLPQNSLQWVLLVIFGPPLYVLGETIGSGLFSSEHGQAISSRRFSIARIAVALLIAVPILAVCLALSWLYGRL